MPTTNVYIYKNTIMEIIKTGIRDVIIIKPRVFGDERGYFFESWNKNTLEKLGFVHDFVQDKMSSEDCIFNARRLPRANW